MVLQRWFRLKLSGWQGSTAFVRRVNEIRSSALLNRGLGVRSLVLSSRLMSLLKDGLMALTFSLCIKGYTVSHFIGLNRLHFFL